MLGLDTATSDRWREVRAALRDRDFKAALPHLEDLYDEAPNDVQVIFWLGACYANLGRLEEAKAQFKRVVRRDPNHAGAWFNLARIYGLMGRRHKMRVSLRKALKADPTHVKARRAAEKYGITVPEPATPEPDIPLDGPPVDFLAEMAAEKPVTEAHDADGTPIPQFDFGPSPDPVAAPRPAPKADDDEPLDEFGEAPVAPRQRWQITALGYGAAADLGWRYGLVLGVSIGLVSAGLVLADADWATAALTALACVFSGALAGALAGPLAAVGANLSCLVSRGLIVDVRRDVRTIELLRIEAGPWAWTVAVATLLAMLIGAGVAAVGLRYAPPVLTERLPEVTAAVDRVPGGWLGLAVATLLLTACSQGLMALLYNSVAGLLGGLMLQLRERDEAVRCVRVAAVPSLRPAVPLAWVAGLPLLLVTIALWHSEPSWLSPLVSFGVWLIGSPLAVAAGIALYNTIADHVRGVDFTLTEQVAPGAPMLHAALTTPTRWK